MKNDAYRQLHDMVSELSADALATTNKLDDLGRRFEEVAADLGEPFYGHLLEQVRHQRDTLATLGILATSWHDAVLRAAERRHPERRKEVS